MNQRKRKEKKLTKIFILIGLAFFLTGCDSNDKPVEEITTTTTKEVPVVNKLSLVMVGDALIHDSVYKDAYNSSTKSYDFTKQLELIKPIISTYDLAFYNQETILGGTSLGLSNYPSFNSPQEVGDAFIDAGFNLVSTATNHSYDKREKGILASREYWLSKEADGVIAAGTYNSESDRNKERIYEKNGIKYAFFAYTKRVNAATLPKGKSYLLNIYDEEQVKKDIEAVRDKVDVVMVSMHWGKDVTSYTNPSAEPWSVGDYKPGSGNNPKEQAKFLASLGVDIIIGHHPHIIQPMEWIDGTLVIYSLGNIISAQASSSNYNKIVGVMTSVDIVKTSFQGETTVKLENLDNELTYCYHNSSYRDFKIVPFSQMNESYNKNYVSLYNTYSAILKMYDDSINVKPLNEGE